MKLAIKLFCMVMLLCSFGEPPKEQGYDLIVYGGTSSGVIASYAAAKEGLKVALIEPRAHVGGLTTSGLTHVDIGNPKTVGGYTREFFERVSAHYGTTRPVYDIESSVAEKIFMDMLKEAGVTLICNSQLAATKGVVGNGSRIEKIILEDGRRLSAKVYIDATYTGDLMAMSGVSFTVGRESMAAYKESSAGIQSYKMVRRFDPDQLTEVKKLAVKFPLDNVFAEKGIVGGADRGVQAYTYRLCVTDVQGNMKPFDKPANYDPRRYNNTLLYVNRLGLTKLNRVFTLTPLPNGKFDLNHMDFINVSWGYPEGSYYQREMIEDYHRDYQQGLLYFLANDPSVPEQLREDTHRYGYALDEFADNGNWPYYLYIREARRMLGQYVMTQHDAWDTPHKDDAICMGSYFMDSHTVQRLIDSQGEQFEEGEMIHAPFRPYEIPYRSLLPRAGECDNLLVTVSLSASHTIYGSMRMEPVYMMTGHAAAVAAAISIDAETTPGRIDVVRLRDKLLSQGQILSFSQGADFYIKPQIVTGYVMDDSDATVNGNWLHSVAAAPFLKYGYRAIGQSLTESGWAEFKPELEVGLYEVQIMYSPDNNRSKKACVIIYSGKDENAMFVDMRQKPDVEGRWFSLGEYNVYKNSPIRVVISNKGEGGIIIADGVRFIKIK